MSTVRELNKLLYSSFLYAYLLYHDLTRFKQIYVYPKPCVQPINFSFSYFEITVAKVSL